MVSDTLWIIEGAGSQVVDLAIMPSDPNEQSRLTLLSALGDYLTEGVVSPADGSERIPAYIVPGGNRLLVQVGPAGNQTPYTLTLASLAARPLAFGQPATSTIQADPIWTFPGAAGQIVDIRLNSTWPTIDPKLQLLDTSGGEIAYDDDSGGDLNARIAAFVLPVDGQYFVKPLPAGSPVSYTLALVETTAQAITLGETVTSTLAQDALWVIDGAAGQPIDVSVTASSGESPSVALWTETGQALPAGDDSVGDGGASSIKGLILPEKGRYLVRIGDIDQDTSYSLTLREAHTRPIEIGVAATSTTIDDAVWTLDAVAGQALSIEMSTTDPTFDPYLTVYAPNGLSLTSDDNGGGNLDARISIFVAPETGRFLVRTGRPGSSSLYTLSVEDLSVSEIRFDETKTSNTQTTELWQFAGQAGQVVDVDLSGWVPGDFDPYLILLGPDGRLLAQNDDISSDDYNAGIAGYLLPQTGTYYIQTGRSGSTAPYGLSLRMRATTPAVLGSRLQATQGGAYTLPINRPLWLRISADQPVELTLVGPGGAALASQAPAILRRVDASGVYTVGVSFPAGEAPRQLAFERVQATPRPLDAGQEGRGELSPNATDLWIVPGGEQRAVRVIVDAASFTPKLALWAPGGGLLAESDADGQLIGILPPTGDALLSVRATGASVRSPYTLTVEPVEVLPGPQTCNESSNASDYLPVRPGSTVILSRQRPVNGDDGWNASMNASVGRTAQVTDLVGTDWVGCPVVNVDVDQGENWWRVRDMMVVAED